MDETKKRTKRKWRVELIRKLGNCIEENLKKLRKNKPFSNRTKSQRRLRKLDKTHPDPQRKITKKQLSSSPKQI